MLIKDVVIPALREKQKQLMEQYAEWEDLQGEFPEDYSLCQSEMERVDWICEKIRRIIYELEELNGECTV